MINPWKLKKVNKPTARKLFREGTIIYLYPCKVNIYNPWYQPVPISLESGDTFDHLVNQFEWYECFSEVGYYAHYYVKEGE